MPWRTGKCASLWTWKPKALAVCCGTSEIQISFEHDDVPPTGEGLRSCEELRSGEKICQHKKAGRDSPSWGGTSPASSVVSYAVVAKEVASSWRVGASVVGLRWPVNQNVTRESLGLGMCYDGVAKLGGRRQVH
jgi:hypothetical protein